MQQVELLYGVRNLKNETATDYVARKDHDVYRRARDKKAMRKQFWHEFGKTHKGLEA